jgi:hypothetical protein
LTSLGDTIEHLIRKQLIFLPDLKPANTIYDPNNEAHPVTLIDLGSLIQARSKEEYENYKNQDLYSS